MVEDYGAEEYSEGSYGGDPYDEVVSDQLIDYFPFIMPRGTDSLFRQYIEQFQEEFDGLDAGLRYVQLSRFIDEAEGDDLDRIGSLFGELGIRGERNDGEYRTFLKSIVSSFNGRGTVPGLKFAVSAGVGGDESNVTIEEDFEANEYTIEVSNVDTEFLSGVINNLAELADPSAITLAEPPIIITEGDSIEMDATTSTVVDSASGLGSGTLTMDGNSVLE